MLTNYHSHTQFCDAKARVEDFVIEAIRLGFSEWGVSPHCPLPMLKYAPWAMSIEDVEPYIAHIEGLKVRYGDRIRIYTGMEIDYIDEQFNPSSDYFQSMPLDFRIGSVHLLRSPRTGELVDVDCSISDFKRHVDYHFSGSLQLVVQHYYKALNSMVELGGFDFLAHPDKISSNTSELSSKICSNGWYQDLVEQFLLNCAARGVVLEINTKAHHSKGVFFPDRQYFERMAQLGIKVVINSDVHHLDRLTVGLREVGELYKGEIVSLKDII